MKETLARKGVEYPSECRIIEVCNARYAKAVMDVEPGISTALPCRISVYEENDKTILATLRPSLMIAMFNRPELAQVADEVEEKLSRAMQSAL
jgi:uncharacterized protein (DUF302 family)